MAAATPCYPLFTATPPAGDLATAFVFGAYDGVVFAIGAAIALVFAWLIARKQPSPAA